MKKVIVLILFVFYLALTPPARSQGSYTANSCSQHDVNIVINGPTHVAVNGDTINIPPGSCNWTSGVTVPAHIGISIIGAGQGVTIITDSITGGSAVFMMNPTFGNATSRISSMTLTNTLPSTGYGNPIGVSGTCTANGCPSLRLDHLTVPSSWACVISDATFANVSNMFGVADHNTVGDVKSTCSNGVVLINVGHGSWQGVGFWGDNSFARPNTFGTAQTFYLENNIFNYAVGTDTDIGGSSGGGARFACRFNTFNFMTSAGACTGHGTDTTGRARGVRQWEGYYNTGTCSDPSLGCGSAWPGRSGVGMSFGNSFTNVGGGFVKGLADLDPQRIWRADIPWGGCDGTSPWDSNDGVTNYSGTVGTFSGLGSGSWTVTDSGSSSWSTNQWAPSGAPYTFYDLTKAYGVQINSNASHSVSLVFLCESCISFRPASGDSYKILRAKACIDQPARAGGLLVTGTNPVLASTGSPGSVNQTIDPTYEADDALPGTADHTIASDTGMLMANRDFYAESIHQSAQSSPTSPFNGNSGTGHGTLANRPATCTPQVGYWATDQGNWNQSGDGGQGELFICTAPNTWSLYYTPYTYPHPLIAGGSTGTGNSPNPPTGLTITVK
jgi:hypothetical protein